MSCRISWKAIHRQDQEMFVTYHSGVMYWKYLTFEVRERNTYKPVFVLTTCHLLFLVILLLWVYHLLFLVILLLWVCHLLYPVILLSRVCHILVPVILLSWVCYLQFPVILLSWVCHLATVRELVCPTESETKVQILAGDGRRIWEQTQPKEYMQMDWNQDTKWCKSSVHSDDITLHYVITGHKDIIWHDLRSLNFSSWPQVIVLLLVMTPSHKDISHCDLRS